MKKKTCRLPMKNKESFVGTYTTKTLMKAVNPNGIVTSTLNTVGKDLPEGGAGAGP